MHDSEVRQFFLNHQSRSVSNHGSEAMCGLILVLLNAFNLLQEIIFSGSP